MSGKAKKKPKYTALENYDHNVRKRTRRLDLIYLIVPFAEKDEAKNLGAKWDAAKRSWFINSGFQNPNAFKSWLPSVVKLADYNKKPVTLDSRYENNSVKTPYQGKCAFKPKTTIGADYEPSFNDDSLPWL